MSTEDVEAIGGAEERQIDHWPAGVGGPSGEASGHPGAVTGTIVSALEVALTQRGSAKQIVSVAGTRRGATHRASAWRRESATCPGSICVASNSPVERARQAVGGEARRAGRAAHRRVRQRHVASIGDGTMGGKGWRKHAERVHGRS
jgi:hypothetical protein